MIYIVSKGNLSSGGPETLHETANILKCRGVDACMFYINPKTRKVPEKYQEYGVKVAHKIIDDEKNIIIVPETLTYFLTSFKKIRKVIWWLSVDFYEFSKPSAHIKRGLKVHNWPAFFAPVEFVGSVLKGNLHFKYYRFQDNGQYFHLYNSEYTHQFILSHGVLEKNTMHMFGPLNHAFFEAANTANNFQRENLVLYNPKKGKEYSDKIISNAKEQGLDVNFIALQNMTSLEIIDLMKRAKIYMDFGFFPGLERIPREAVLLGCNVITSKNGSAANDIDEPMPQEFKFEDTEENIENIVHKMGEMLQSYNEYYPLFDAWREKVKMEVPLYNESIDHFIEYFI